MEARFLRFEAKSQYGNVRVFPVGDAAKAVQLLTARKSVEPRDLQALAMLGIVAPIVANGLNVRNWELAQDAGKREAK